MHYRVQLARHMDVISYIIFHEQEFFVAKKMLYVVGGAGDEIIHPYDGMAPSHQIIADMTAQKSGGPGYQYPHGRPTDL